MALLAPAFNPDRTSREPAMSVTAEKLRQSGKFRVRGNGKSSIVRPANLKELRNILDPISNFPTPIRPVGANSSSTDCNGSAIGTVVDMTAFDNIINIDAYSDTVIVQPGVKIGVLAEALAQHGLELAGTHDLLNRTVGGAIAGGCIGPAIAGDGAFFASQVLSMKIATPAGKLLQVNNDKKNLLNAFRLSYGMLGVIFEVALRVRPVTPFAVVHRRCTIKQFAAAAEKLSASEVGIKFYLMPFRDRVYLDLRRYSTEARGSRKMAWKLKDWGESTVLPNVVRSLNRVVPVSGVRYRIIDEISKVTQGIVNNKMVSSGSNSTVHGSKGAASSALNYSTWFFPAADFSIVVQTYADFCNKVHKNSGFRCDLPTVGFRLSRDRSALLSPSFDESMFALRAVSTQTDGWEDFAIDFADFAAHWGGSPLFNQSRNVEPQYAVDVFGSRLNFFRRIRRQLDPDNRMMNPFLSQYFL
jgi:hypothetical protein